MNVFNCFCLLSTKGYARSNFIICDVKIHIIMLQTFYTLSSFQSEQLTQLFHYIMQLLNFKQLFNKLI